MGSIRNSMGEIHREGNHLGGGEWTKTREKLLSVLI